MSKFEEVFEGVQYTDDDGDVLEMTTGSDAGVLLDSGDGVWVDSKDLRQFVKYMASLSDVDGEFIEASGHEVETLSKSIACGVGESRVSVDTVSKYATAEIAEESARNLWAIAQVLRDNENRKAEEEKPLPEVGSYVTVGTATLTTYGFPLILDEGAQLFVVSTDPWTRNVSISGMAAGKRRVYTVSGESVTPVRPKAAIGDRVTVSDKAKMYSGTPASFGGETVGTITEIHGHDATVFGYHLSHKDFIHQQVALDYLTPAEEPKVGDRVFVHRDAKTSDGSHVYFDGEVEGVVVARGRGPWEGDLRIESEKGRINEWTNSQYVGSMWVAVLPPVVPEVGDWVLVPKDATTSLGHPVYTTKKDIVATVQSEVNTMGNIAVRTDDPLITTTFRQCMVDPKKVQVLKKAADIEAARAKALEGGSVKFEDLPKNLQRIVDEGIERNETSNPK